MVHFTRSCSCTLYIQVFRWHHRWCRITPFGNPGVNGYVLLSPAYRSLSRPSSPYSSQASAIDLYSLDHIIFSALSTSFALTKAFYSSFLLFALAVSSVPSKKLNWCWNKFRMTFSFPFLPYVFQKTCIDSLTDQGRKQSHKTLRVLCFKSFNLLAGRLAFFTS